MSPRRSSAAGLSGGHGFGDWRGAQVSTRITCPGWTASIPANAAGMRGSRSSSALVLLSDSAFAARDPASPGAGTRRANSV
jgi:hypothetical protein